MTKMRETDWVERFLGIPFLSGGRTEQGADCWGLARLVVHELTGRWLPSFVDAYTDALDIEQTERALLDGSRSIAKPVDDPRPGDLCLMRSRGRVGHVAVLARLGWLLHTDRGTDSCLVRAEDISVRGRIVGWYRVC